MLFVVFLYLLEMEGDFLIEVQSLSVTDINHRYRLPVNFIIYLYCGNAR